MQEKLDGTLTKIVHSDKSVCTEKLLNFLNSSSLIVADFVMNRSQQCIGSGEEDNYL